MNDKVPGICKARINADGVELEVEGINLDLPALMSQVAEMRRSLGPPPAPAPMPRTDGGPATSLPLAAISTNTIASLSDATTGSDLVMAAMAHITLIQRKDVATRREILDEMKAAKTFYKDTFSGNLSSYLDSLAKAKRLNLVAKETYALPNSERQSFDRLIADAN